MRVRTQCSATDRSQYPSSAGAGKSPRRPAARSDSYWLIRCRDSPASSANWAALCRSLRDWLSWWLHDGGDSPPPADPDAVRAVVDQARSALRERSLQACSEDHRTGLAWCDHWLDRIAQAASRETQ